MVAVMTVHDEYHKRSEKVLLNPEELLIQACVVQENFMEEVAFVLCLNR